MAKKNFSLQFDGLLDLDKLLITEEDKNGVRTYNLADELEYFNGRSVVISIKEQEPVLPKE